MCMRVGPRYLGRCGTVGESHDCCSTLSPLQFLRQPNGGPSAQSAQSAGLKKSAGGSPSPQMGGGERAREASVDRTPPPQAPGGIGTLSVSRRSSTANTVTPYEYCALFEDGERAYEAGDWTTATSRLLECQKILPGDHPARLLIGVMSRFNFNAPGDWKGSRVLTEK